MGNFRVATALVLGLAGVAATACGRGDERFPAGRVVYEQRCASCHGPEGRGDGPVAATLGTPPADLTQIAARHDGSFDEGWVMSVIDGRRQLAAHGSREMPVWGAVFRAELSGEPYPEFTTLLRVRNLMDYLRSIQAPSEPRRQGADR